MSFLLFLLGAILLSAAGVALFASFDVGFELFILSIALMGAAILCFVGADNLHGQEENTSVEASARNNDTSASNNLTAADSNSDEVTNNSAQSDDSKFPRPWPGDDSKEEVQDKWWSDWADNMLNSNTIVGCKDGVQIVLFQISVDTDGKTSSVSGYVRQHQDGKPYTCDESKDPAKEVSL